MVRFLRSLPFAVEFAAVVAVAFGVFIFRSLFIAFHPLVHAYRHQPATSLLHTIAFETAVMAALFPFLRIRGWTFDKIGLRPTLRDTGIGVLLFAATYAVWTAVWVATVFISPQTAVRIHDARVFTQPLPVAISRRWD